MLSHAIVVACVSMLSGLAQNSMTATLSAFANTIAGEASSPQVRKRWVPRTARCDDTWDRRFMPDHPITWIGRFCRSSSFDPDPTDSYFDLCFTWDRRYGTDCPNQSWWWRHRDIWGPDTTHVPKYLLQEGLMNIGRLPKKGGNSLMAGQKCPSGYVCQQFLDRERDAQVRCRRGKKFKPEEDLGFFVDITDKSGWGRPPQDWMQTSQREIEDNFWWEGRSMDFFNSGSSGTSGSSSGGKQRHKPFDDFGSPEPVAEEGDDRPWHDNPLAPSHLDLATGLVTTYPPRLTVSKGS